MTTKTTKAKTTKSTKTVKTTKENSAATSQAPAVSNETKVVCPQCGAEFAIPAQSSIMIGVLVGKDSGLGTVSPSLAGKNKAVERIEALRQAGVDVSDLFAIQGANGGEFIASNADGILKVLPENDPIFQKIKSQGVIPDRRLFRRWVMSQMFHMLSDKDYNGNKRSLTAAIRAKGYQYQWKMVLDEFRAQEKMVQNNDMGSLRERRLWFNKDIVLAMVDDYLAKLQAYISSLPEKHCKRIPYKRIAGKNIFCSDIQNKIYFPLKSARTFIDKSMTPRQMLPALKRFVSAMVKLPNDTAQCKVWVDAYKGAGAYYTMQNLIRFHECRFYTDAPNRYRMAKEVSMDALSQYALQYQNEGWRMVGVLKQMLADNNIDIQQKMNEWRK